MTPSAPHRPTDQHPFTVAELNGKIGQWINRLGRVFVEGQLAEFNTNPRWSLAYMVLRDTDADYSIKVKAPKRLTEGPSPIKTGDRVIIGGKVDFWAGKGELSIMADSIRHVGVGELLERIERLRRQLAQEGLTAPERKKPLPYLPHTIGLITGRSSDAEHDVIDVSKDRWPEVTFRIINTAVQGAKAAGEIIDALHVLDADPDVDVIIITRGGGSVEDLLPFSEEKLARAVAAAHTPVVSAVGHQMDTPVIDDVCDLRAATPTDAAKRVVPDTIRERALLAEARQRSAAALRGWVTRQQETIAALRGRPVLAHPMLPIDQQEEIIDRSLTMLRKELHALLRDAVSETASLRSRVGALGPAATLARGYSIVQTVPHDKDAEPEVVTLLAQSPPGTQLRIRVTDGSINAAAIAITPAN